MSDDLVVAVRFADPSGVNTLKELDDLIDKYGYVWFGKFGQPVAREPIKTKLPAHAYLLAYRSRPSRQRIAQTHERIKLYQIVGVRKSIPRDGVYPEYYEAHIPQIRTWFCVRRCDQNLQLDDLEVASSGRKLSEAAQRSMKGHFLCRLRGDN